MKYYDEQTQTWKDVQVKVANAIQNEYGESNNDGYSQNYLNEHTINVGVNSTDYRINFVKGNNLFDGLLELGDINGSTGQNSASSTGIRCVNYIDVRNLNTITINKNYITGEFYILEYYANGTYKGLASKGTMSSVNTKTYDVSNVGYIRFTNPHNTNLNVQIMINEGSEALPYEPYITPSIYVDNDIIYEEKVIQGTCTLGNEYDYDNIAYPDGYNKDNCVVIGCVHKSSSASVWTTGMDTNVELLNGVIGIIARDYPTGSTIDYKIVLKKI